MWAEALAEKERTKDGGSREAESGENEGKKKKKKLTTLMKQLFFPVGLDVMLESQSHFKVEA